MPEGRSLLFVTDLDGTLLDHDSYSYAAARPALSALRRRGVPLVLCSSKTRGEMRRLARELDLDTPFIVENGGAIAWPRHPGSSGPPKTIVGGEEWLLPLGTPVSELATAFDAIRTELPFELIALGALSVDELVALTGLPRDAARLARQREWSLPFFTRAALTSGEEAALAAAVSARGLRLTTGGRFRHLHGASDKGDAVLQLRTRLSADGHQPPYVVALGDAPNDAEMLCAADLAIVIPGPNPDLTRRLRARVPAARVAPAPGPGGWNAAVLAALDELLPAPSLSAPPSSPARPEPS